MVKKTLSLALAAVFMVLTLTACGKKHVGKWNITIDFGQAIADSMENDPFGTDADFSGIVINAIVEFNKNGTYSIQLNQDSLSVATDKMIDIIADDVYDSIDPTMLGEKPEFTKEEYRELLAESITTDAISENLGLEGFGSYTYDGGKITLEGGMGVIYEVDGDSIKLEFEKEGYSIKGAGIRAE